MKTDNRNFFKLHSSNNNVIHSDLPTLKIQFKEIQVKIQGDFIKFKETLANAQIPRFLLMKSKVPTCYFFVWGARHILGVQYLSRAWLKKNLFVYWFIFINNLFFKKWVFFLNQVFKYYFQLPNDYGPNNNRFLRLSTIHIMLIVDSNICLLSCIFIIL